MSSNEKKACIRQAVGVFYDEPPLKSTIDDLLAWGFDRSELALLASEQIVENSLGEMYSRTNAGSDAPKSPGIAFVDKDALGETTKSLGGGVFFVAAAFVMAGLVLAAALLGGAMIAAIVGIVAVVAVGALVATISQQSDAEKLKEQVDKGHILLFVRITEPGKEKEVMAMLKKHNAADIQMYNSPLKPLETAQPQGLSF